MFAECDSLKSITILSNVTSIRDFAFDEVCLLHIKARFYAETYAKENNLEYDYN